MYMCVGVHQEHQFCVVASQAQLIFVRMELRTPAGMRFWAAVDVYFGRSQIKTLTVQWWS